MQLERLEQKRRPYKSNAMRRNTVFFIIMTMLKYIVSIRRTFKIMHITSDRKVEMTHKSLDHWFLLNNSFLDI